ncbi:MAG: hypothetical protein WDZ45_07945 [Flavobacteriaceae bacterium]
MPNFYLSGELSHYFEFEIHQEACLYLPDESSRKFYGFFKTSQEALDEISKKTTNVNGCFWCCNSIHQGRIPFVDHKSKTLK